MKKYPALICYPFKSNTDFSFLVKRKVGVYDVFDYDKDRFLSLCIKRQLPTEVFEDEESLKLFLELLETMGFHGKKIEGNKVQFIDPEHEAYEDLDLPLYEAANKCDTSFSYLNTSYVKKNVPTKETVKSAYEYRDMVYKKIKETNVISEVVFGIESSLDGVSIIYETKEDVSEILNKEKFLVFHIKKPYGSYYMYKSLIISRAMAKHFSENGKIQIVVPKDIAGIVIGKKGGNITKLSEELGIKISIVN